MTNWVVTPDKYLTQDETRRLLKTCREAAIVARSRGNQTAVRDQLIIELALGTGLRVSELANLKIEDLYLKKGQNSLLVRNGKGGKARAVQFGTRLKQQLLQYLDYRKSVSPWLFWSQRREQMTPSAIQQTFKRWARKAGLPRRYSIHSLRHTYATDLYKASGYNLRLVQKQLGHSSISTTQIYADSTNQDLTQALANLDTLED